MAAQYAGRSSRMRFEEFVPIVGIMKSVWTRREFLPDEFAVKTWYGFLKDLPTEHVKMAVEKLALTKEDYPPTIAEIRRVIVEVQSDDNTWSDGWENVLQAVRRFGYINEKAALDSMDEMTRQTVGVDGIEGTPVPIPNTEVKLNYAEDTWVVTPRENRKMPTPIFLHSSVGRAHDC